MNRVSLTYLASYALSMLGNSIAGIALPLLVLQLTGSALATGAVAVASALPAAVAGLVMGVVIDRTNRRTASVVTDLISAASIAALPLVDSTLGLSVTWFVLFAVIGSFGDVPGLTAREAMVPGIARAGRISPERLLGLRESVGAVVLLAGPAAAGTLMALLDGTTVLWITAATSATAALLTLLLPRDVGAITRSTSTSSTSTSSASTSSTSTSSTSHPSGERVRMREGWRTLVRSPFLLATTAISLSQVLVISGFQALVLPVHFTALGRPELLGLVLSALAAGLLTGAGLYASLGRRGRRRTWFTIGLSATVVGFAVMGTLADPWVVFGAAVLVGFGNGLFGTLVGVLMVERIPDDLRGRVGGTQNALLSLAPAIGMGGAAVLTETSGPGLAAGVLAAVWVVTGVLSLVSRSLRDLERGPEPPTALVRTPS